MGSPYDLIIIGAGSGGLVAARFAAQLGKKVALIDKNRVGGDCTWTGCVPSKALLKVAKVAYLSRHAAQYGLEVSNPIANMIQVREYIRRVQGEVYQHESPNRLAEEGIDVVLGEARFLDRTTIRVNQESLKARNFLIATGAHPYIPEIEGLNEVPYLTYEHIFENDRLPIHLLILGAGPIGAEMAQAYARLGAEVTMVGQELMPKDEPEAVEVIRKVFAREGIHFLLGTATAVRYENGSIILKTNDSEVKGDMLLVAVGRSPTVDGLDLEKAGVKYSHKGIEVNKNLQTSAKLIYAAGDCIGGYQFSHLAGWQAFQATRNALLPGNSRGFTNIVPWTTFTDPELAHVGLSEAEARKSLGDEVRVARRNMGRVDRAVTDNETDGFIKIIHRKNGTILGATIVAERAGEMINEFVLALKNKVKVGDLAGAIHVYPTYSTAVQQLASEISIDGFLDSALGKAIQQLSRS